MIGIKRNYIFDFDSTLTSVEALDVLCEITQAANPDKEAVLQEIVNITNQGIDGEISFTESLERRIKLLNAKKSHLSVLITELNKYVSPSIERNKEFFENFSDDIYIISAGFKEFIVPIVAKYNIPADKVFANTFKFDKDDNIIGFDAENPLSKHNGKIECLQSLELEGEIQVIGDGYSDAVTKEAGVADTFFAYTENVSREKTVENADHIAPTLDEFLYVNKLPRNISFPKHRIKILLLENIHSDAFDKLSTNGFTVETVSRNLSEEELIKKIKDVHVLGIRSKTQVTKKVIEAAEKLMVISTFCVDTKQINLDVAKENGEVVFNAPHSNTRKDIADFVPTKIMAYINSGNTVNAVNFPNIRLPQQKNAHRFLHIHKNIPGVMAKINKVLAKFQLNITGQYLSTDEKIGYVITDVNKKYNQEVIAKLRKVEGTIKFRVLY